MPCIDNGCNKALIIISVKLGSVVFKNGPMSISRRHCAHGSRMVERVKGGSMLTGRPVIPTRRFEVAEHVRVCNIQL